MSLWDLELKIEANFVRGQKRIKNSVKEEFGHSGKLVRFGYANNIDIRPASLLQCYFCLLQVAKCVWKKLLQMTYERTTTWISYSSFTWARITDQKSLEFLLTVVPIKYNARLCHWIVNFQITDHQVLGCWFHFAAPPQGSRWCCSLVNPSP